ncbi:uncharacterized protein LOC131443409 isoform X1 [Solea solea]|uniref:uncharacterized protein LOC131443409 isoform X1 n=1 Tax=Solea solea TaxID=90069 RepID=UPI00272BBBAA|nr:uncharacterized protein LOC131443409 isoform X1 [Solea solea]
MCLFSIPVHVSSHRYYKPHNHSQNHRNLSSLIYPTRSTHIQHHVAGSLWNCQSATPKTEFISGFATEQCLDFLALTETWITPSNTATPAALSSAHSFSHTPRSTGRGGGTGLLINPNWTFTLYPLPHFSSQSFEFHAVTVTHPVKLIIVVIYRPPGPLGHFLEELDVLLSNIPENGPPLVLLGDFNIQSEKSSDLLLLLSSLSLSLAPSPPTHKAGNHLDLIFTRNCSTSDLTVTPLQVSDHFFFSYSLPLSQSDDLISSDTALVCRNIRSLSPSSLSSTVLSALPSADSFSLMHPNSATDTFLSTLSSSLDSLCPLTSRRVRKSSPAPWLSDSVRAERATIRAAERKWRKSKHPFLPSRTRCLRICTYPTLVLSSKPNIQSNLERICV